MRAAQVGAEVLDGLRRELANARECFEPPSLGDLYAARARFSAAEATYAAELTEVRKRRAEGLAALKMVRGHREQLDAAIRAGKPALADLEAMADSRCPTCDQPWIPTEAKADRLFAVAEAAEAARREMPEVLQIEDAATARKGSAVAQAAELIDLGIGLLEGLLHFRPGVERILAARPVPVIPIAVRFAPGIE